MVKCLEVNRCRWEHFYRFQGIIFLVTFNDHTTPNSRADPINVMNLTGCFAHLNLSFVAINCFRDCFESDKYYFWFRLPVR